MVTKSLRFLLLSEFLMLAATAWACAGDGNGNLQEPPNISAVTVSAPATSIQVDQTVQLTATARDADGAPLDNATFEWTTTDASVAAVSQTGLLTGIAVGQAEVRASSGGVSGNISITVAPAVPENPAVGLQEIATGLKFPVYLTAPAGDERLFIVEKGGRVRVIKDGRLLVAPFLDLRPKISTGQEQGLLGLAFAPDYVSSGRLIVHYTDRSGNTRVSQFQVSGDPDLADPMSESVVLMTDHPGTSHNGGQIVFGPDGFLYIGLGDGGSLDGNDQGRAQSLGDLLGSILRIDVSLGLPYLIPPDNPFAATVGARPEIWSYGLRNPWRFSFDRATGDLYLPDVGENRWEEVNVSRASEGAGRGANYGWSRMEGSDCMQAAGCDQTDLVLPVLQYDHDSGCAITGGYVYRGSGIPALQGQYFYSDFCRGWVRSFRVEGGAAVEGKEWPTLQLGQGVTSFGEDAQGELYLLTQQGSVFKIVPQ